MIKETKWLIEYIENFNQFNVLWREKHKFSVKETTAFLLLDKFEILSEDPNDIHSCPFHLFVRIVEGTKLMDRRNKILSEKVETFSIASPHQKKMGVGKIFGYYDLNEALEGLNQIKEYIEKEINR